MTRNTPCKVRTAGADVDSVAAAQQNLQLDELEFCGRTTRHSTERPASTHPCQRTTSGSGRKGRDYGDDHVAMSHDVTDPHFILIFTTTYSIPGERTVHSTAFKHYWWNIQCFAPCSLVFRKRSTTFNRLAAIAPTPDFLAGYCSRVNVQCEAPRPARF